jgi:4-phospho-D-threonate 3-dehydrogenase / 4-phospho-D-erythronate 3-dehydrogenase
MGDPAGVGPEVIVGAWSNELVHRCSQPFVVGHPEILKRASRLLDSPYEVIEINSPEALSSLAASQRTIPCVRSVADDVLAILPGGVDSRAGEAAYQAVRLAADLALERRVEAIVTAPLSKAALHAAGHDYPGHTELLAEICGIREFAMMLYLPPRGAGQKSRRAEEPQESIYSTTPLLHRSTTPHSHGLGVIHVTLHQPLRSVFADVTTEAILSKCLLVDGVMRRLGVNEPRLAVCALNPHAGEDGLFGDEEQTVIDPAVEAARRDGLRIDGPYPADTLMLRARDGEFDAVIAMYHDQGHIALKLLGMHAAVNITLGLPIVRTSVAHGTAFDRAWQGTARCDGMVAAICTAANLSRAGANS